MDIRLTRIRTLCESLYLHYTNIARLYIFTKETEKCPKRIGKTHHSRENTKRLFQTVQNLKNQTADLENKLNAVLKFKLFR